MKVTPETLTDDQIRYARAKWMIDRSTYENAMYGGSEALARVCDAINAINARGAKP